MPKGKARFHRPVGKRLFFWGRSQYKQSQERLAFVQRDKKRTMKKKGDIGDKIPLIWEWRYGEKFGTVTGYCRSDAKSAIKRVLGIPKKKSLPKEVQIRKVEFNDTTTST
jgi:hypothetical protein